MRIQSQIDIEPFRRVGYLNPSPSKRPLNVSEEP